MSINKFNIEGYEDPTAYEALTHINAEERKGRFRPMVYICSPFSGDPEGNTEKAKRYCRYATQAGYLPFAPHYFCVMNYPANGRWAFPWPSSC